MYNAAGQLGKDQLLEHFRPLVKRLAYHLMARLPASVQVEDLEQNGMIGLLDAIDRFEAGHGAQFETYAGQRVRGAMLDGLRQNDWLPRSLRRDFRRIEVAIAELEQKYGRAPSEKEIASLLGKTLAEYQKMLLDARGHQLIYLEDLADEGELPYLDTHLGDDTNDPAKVFESKDLEQFLAQGIRTLPEREKLMMTLHYEEGLNLREIGEIMGVTESRVSQIHSQVVLRLRARLLDSAGVVKKAAKCNE